jgi:predicted lipoprotein with Yx(FWY)xxD motif
MGALPSAFVAILLLGISSSPSFAETHSYAISLVHTATYPTDQDCPKGGNGNVVDIEKHILLGRGYTEEQAQATIAAQRVEGGSNVAGQEARHFDFLRRGSMEGKPAYVAQFPTSEPDPEIETVQGRYAYGFDLTGHAAPYSFQDPDTHEMVENQMWRVLGCFTGYRVKLPTVPYSEGIRWDTIEDSMPAWLITVSGQDLGKDGPVTVTFDRSLDILIRDTNGGVLSDSSYTLDPNPRSHNIFRGSIKDHVLTIEPGDFYMQGESQFYPHLSFKQTHLRLQMRPDGQLSGLIGGYQPWREYFHYLAITTEDSSQVDISGVYYAMRRLADGIPDAATGQNTAISSAYYLQAVPAFVVPAKRLMDGPNRSIAEVIKAPLTTPDGIILAEVMRENPASEPQVLWTRLGDAEGRTLFISEQDTIGKSSCSAQCLQEFPPLLAPRGAKPVGDWSIVTRSDGHSQWAYQSHALYTWAKEKEPGEIATNVALAELSKSKQAETVRAAASLLPPEGWRVARFTPAAALGLPDGLDARLTLSAQAVVLTDNQGLTLYAFNGEAKRDGQICVSKGECTITWLPVQAPALAVPPHGFSVVARLDGSSQWAYQGHPLYSYSGDKLPGDAHGIGVDKRWGAAAISENFRPRGVVTATLNGYGDILTADDMTLYGGYMFERRWGGRDLRNTFTNLYAKGKRLGAAACVDQGCLQTWRPFLAPNDARPNGFWEPISRPDGARQWAYKGYAVYTYSAGDKIPGDHNGQGIYDFAPEEGTPAQLRRTSFLEGLGASYSGGAGIYWHVLNP